MKILRQWVVALDEIDCELQNRGYTFIFAGGMPLIVPMAK